MMPNRGVIAIRVWLPQFSIKELNGVTEALT